MAKIAHLTCAHPRHHTRIFARQCRTLAACGHEVTLVVADGAGASRDDGVRIVDVGRLPGRVNRALRATARILAAARALDADVYQLHDPGLIPAGLRLKRQGKKVVFDAHEEMAAGLLGQRGAGAPAQLLTRSLGAYQRFACRRFDGIIAATPAIRDQFLQINPATVDVNNFPLLRDGDTPAAWTDKAAEVCYVGSIAAGCGIRELVRACALVRSPARLALVGAFAEPALENEVTAFPGWNRATAHGHLDRASVRRVLARAVAGLATLHPRATNPDALPLEMLEYMAAGIPVIVSRFPLWRDIVEGNACGVCVDPADPVAIAAAIDHFVLHPDMARRMGENGRREVLEKYNWQPESRKLVDFYAHL
ncbi:MAG: glycosyltransferase family 4 protein [Ramlibacter sp.]